jgi:hypothetical protein
MGKDLNELASYMLPLAQELLDQASAAGLDPVVEDTGRTQIEQENNISNGVSWTTRSKHLPQPPEMKSEAIDVVPRACMSLKYWGWNGTIENSHPYWGRLIAIGESVGLESGVHFPHPDPGHFQYIHSTNAENVADALASD